MAPKKATTDRVNNQIVLKLPIKIRPTINNDGYVITDADDIEHFFYYNDLQYDGWCAPMKKSKSKVSKKRFQYIEGYEELVEDPFNLK